MEIHEFLMARFDEDAAAAHRQCAVQTAKDGIPDSSRDSWFSYPGGHDVYVGDSSDHSEQPIATTRQFETACYIACYDPARVLREIEAKRRILARVAFPLQEHEEHLHYDRGGGDWRGYLGSDLLLRLLTAPYAEHPDFDPAWKVEG